MKTRIDSFIKAEGLSSSKLADMLGVQPSSISHLLAGRNKPGFDFIYKILQRFPLLNPDWLILGSGDMYRTKSSTTGEQFARQPILTETKNSPKIEQNSDINRLILTDSVTTEIDSKQPESIKPQNQRSVERIVIFYDNKTFKEYISE